MNDQSQMMNQPPPQMLNQMISQPPPPQIQMMAQSQAQQSQIMMMNQSKQQSQLLPMLNRGYNQVWPQHASMDHPSNKFQSSSSLKPIYTAALKPGRSNWKGKKLSDKHKNPRRMEKSMSIPMPMPMPMPNPAIIGPSSSGGGYNPPALYELQSQNRFKARKFHQKKKYNNRVAPYAPRNTTSFIIRAKKTGGIADLVSPCPVTPAVLPTPIFSPSREVLGDMAKEEWGVDGYGSMKGLIRLRGGNEHEEEEEDENGGSSESDVEEHVEVERRLDHDLSRFEMIYPNYSGLEYHNVLENRVDDQDSHIAQLEEENLTLKERLFLMERELGDLRRRLQFLERQNQVMGDVNEEVVENGSENESEGGLDATALMGCINNADMGFVPGKGGKERTTDKENDVASGNEGVSGVCTEEFEERKHELLPKEVIAEKNKPKGEEIMKENVVKDAEMRTESVRNEVIAVESDAKNKEGRIELLPNEAAIAKEEVKVEKVANEFVSDIELTSVNDGTGIEKVMDTIVEKNEFRNEELRNVSSEKSIGDGD